MSVLSEQETNSRLSELKKNRLAADFIVLVQMVVDRLPDGSEFIARGLGMSEKEFGAWLKRPPSEFSWPDIIALGVCCLGAQKQGIGASGGVGGSGSLRREVPEHALSFAEAVHKDSVSDLVIGFCVLLARTKVVSLERMIGDLEGLLGNLKSLADDEQT